MTIIDRLWEAYSLHIETTAQSPNRVYLGREDVFELKNTDEYRNSINLQTDEVPILGMKIFVVNEPHHFYVTRAPLTGERQ